MQIRQGLKGNDLQKIKIVDETARRVQHGWPKTEAATGSSGVSLSVQKISLGGLSALRRLEINRI
jgi:hypothetical protein